METLNNANRSNFTYVASDEDQEVITSAEAESTVAVDEVETADVYVSDEVETSNDESNESNEVTAESVEHTEVTASVTVTESTDESGEVTTDVTVNEVVEQKAKKEKDKDKTKPIQVLVLIAADMILNSIQAELKEKNLNTKRVSETPESAVEEYMLHRQLTFVKWSDFLVSETSYGDKINIRIGVDSYSRIKVALMILGEVETFIVDDTYIPDEKLDIKAVSAKIIAIIKESVTKTLFTKKAPVTTPAPTV